MKFGEVELIGNGVEENYKNQISGLFCSSEEASTLLRRSGHD